MGKAQRIRLDFETVVGVTYDDHQAVLAECSEGEQLRLVHEPANEYDSKAIRVERLNGDQLGYIAREFNRTLHGYTKRGWHLLCYVEEIKGGTEELSYGCDVVILRARTEVEDSEVVEFLTEKTGLGHWQLPSEAGLGVDERNPHSSGCLSTVILIAVIAVAVVILFGILI